MANEYLIVPTDEEVDEQYNRAATNVSHQYSRYPNNSYEEGIMTAIEYLLGEAEGDPMPPESGY